MPTQIKTEKARVALAHREYEQEMGKHYAKLRVRLRALGYDTDSVESKADFERLMKLVAKRKPDEIIGKLMVEVIATDVWHEFIIGKGAIPTIQDDGTVTWKAPEPR